MLAGEGVLDPAGAGAVSSSPVPVLGVISEVAVYARFILPGQKEGILLVDRFVTS